MAQKKPTECRPIGIRYRSSWPVCEPCIRHEAILLSEIDLGAAVSNNGINRQAFHYLAQFQRLTKRPSRRQYREYPPVSQIIRELTKRRVIIHAIVGMQGSI